MRDTLHRLQDAFRGRDWLRVVLGLIVLGWQVAGHLGNLDFLLQLASSQDNPPPLIDFFVKPPGWTLWVGLMVGFGLIGLPIVRASHRLGRDSTAAGESPFSGEELREFRRELSTLDAGDVTGTRAYLLMRPHLSGETRRKLEAGRYTVVGTPNWEVGLLMDHIAHWERELEGVDWTSPPHVDEPSIDGLGAEHVKRLETLLDGSRRFKKTDSITRLLFEDGLIRMERDLGGPDARFSINPEIRDDVLEWRRDRIREYIEVNDHIPFFEFLRLFKREEERHEVRQEVFRAAQNLGPRRRKMVDWKDGERVTIRGEMIGLVEELVGPLQRHSVILEKAETELDGSSGSPEPDSKAVEPQESD